MNENAHKPVIYIHIGTDKTGSTAIQKLLHWNRDKLLNIGMLYPQSGVMHYDHARLKIALDQGNEVPWKQLRDEIATCPGCDVVLSHEGFYHFDSLMLERLRQWLPPYEIKIILYLRRQDEMIESGILQQLKTGEEIFDIDRLSVDVPFWPHLDYASLVKRWVAVFGVEYVTLRPYGRSIFSEGKTIYSDFLSCLNIDPCFLEGLDLPERDPNPSLDAASAHALCFLHRLGLSREQHDTVVDLLLHYQRKFGKSKAHLLNFSQRCTLLERYKLSNQKLDTMPSGFFSMQGEPDSVVLSDEEVTVRLDYLYSKKYVLKGCREWYGEPGFVKLVESGQVLLEEGFYPVEKWGAWMRGNVIARMVFRVPRTMVGNIELAIDVKFLCEQELNAKVRLMGCSWMPLNMHTVITIPSAIYTEQYGLVNLEFYNERAKSPADIGISEDDNRLLGPGIFRMAFKEVGNE